MIQMILPLSVFNLINASKQEGDKTWYFDENNTSFELTPFGSWQDDDTSQEESQNEETQNSKKIVKVEYVRESFLKNYVFSDNKTDFEVNKKHARIKRIIKRK